jgi:SgrR family transcriptional regulator
MKLFDQYSLLYRQFSGQPSSPGLPELARLLASTERNVRLQLAKMQACGWVEWRAGCGRGHRSMLIFLQSPDSLRLARLQQLIDQGDMELAFASLAEQERQSMMASLPALLGAQPHGRELRMALYRAPASLDPVLVSSRLESYLVRQLFDRLCGFDFKQQKLLPALAHAWESSADGRRWRFWLRPDLRFHDGSPLDSTVVAASMQRLHEEGNPFRRQYRHLVDIECHGPLSLSFVLADTDWLWPNRLVSACASIVPPHRRADFGWMPIGSGPFAVQRHSELRLSLAANPYHYRERPLLDRVDLWILPGQVEGAHFDLQLSSASSDATSPVRTACSYLLLNPGRFPSLAARRQLMRWLAEPALVAADDPDRRPTLGLLPQWQHPLPDAEGGCPFPRGSRLSLVCFELAGFQPLAAAIAERLAGAGVSLQVQTLSYPQFVQSECWWGQTDLVLSSEMFHGDEDYACHEWFGGNLILREAMDADTGAMLDQCLLAIQCEPSRAARMAAYREIGDRLVAGGWILPLSHERQRVLTHPQLAGLEMGEGGWMDLSRLWLRD